MCGDKVAGHELYAKSSSILRGYIFSHKSINNLSDLEKDEIYSETLEISIKKFVSYNGSSSFSTFLCGLAKLKIKEKLRNSLKIENTIELSENFTTFENPLTILIKKEEKEIMQNAIKSLSEEHSIVVKLRHQGVSAKHISIAINCSEATVYSKYYRAIKKLREYIKNNF